MFSIVMLTWNNHDTFYRCLQTMIPLMLDDRVEEILILDNGSHELKLLDLLKKVNKQFKKFKVTFGSENIGIARGRKFLFQEAVGEHIFSFDSDVVILNHQALLDIYLKFISQEDHWLMGGGGGNHVFFPSFDLRDVNNFPASDNINEVKYVDEVAGWFHAFPSKILKCNGGQIYMDERFTPFWGEDSDFCYQIRLLNKRCGIIGKGAIAHQWSSCDKEKTRETLYSMWKKLADKWYPKFGDKFAFDFDEEFYNSNYNKDNFFEKISIKDTYFNRGMYKGEIASRNFVTNLFPEVKFVSDTELTYQNKTMDVTKFVDDHMTWESIVQKHYCEVKNTLKEDGNAIFFTSNDCQKSLVLLKELAKKNKQCNMVFNFTKGDHTPCIEFIENEFENYHISSFFDYQHLDISFMVLCKKLSSYKFKYVMKIHSSIENKHILNLKLKDIRSYEIPEYGLCDPEDIQKEETNRYNYLGLQKLITPQKEYEFCGSGCFIQDFELLSKHSSSFVFEIALENALRIPLTYENLVNPRSSPHHVLRKFLGFIGYVEVPKKSLVLYPCTIDCDSDIEEISTNIKFLKQSGRQEIDVLIFNTGSLKSVKTSSLGCDYYFVGGEVPTNYHIIIGLRNMVSDLEDYNNIVCFFESRNLEAPIDDFMNESIYKNISISQEQSEINMKLFSICATFYDTFFNFIGSVLQKAKEQENTENSINIEQTVQKNVKQLFRLDHIWNVVKDKQEEDEEEECFVFYREREKASVEDDFPLTM